MGRILDGLDHPIIFVIFLTMAVLGTKSLLEFGFKHAGWTGPAALAE